MNTKKASFQNTKLVHGNNFFNYIYEIINSTKYAYNNMGY